MFPDRKHSFLSMLYMGLECLQVTLLARLHHRNLVNLVGYCVDKEQRMLVYEFMTKGSLENLLYSKSVVSELVNSEFSVHVNIQVYKSMPSVFYDSVALKFDIDTRQKMYLLICTIFFLPL